MKDYHQLSDTWEDDVPSFLQWIVVVCEYKEDSSVYLTLKQNINSEAELKSWIKHYDGNFDDIESVTDNYLASKLATA